MPTDVLALGDLKPGDLYEDCSYHPCLCVAVADSDEVRGISLVDGSYPRSCSISRCGVRRLSVEEARQWKQFGPQGIELEPEDRWWEAQA